MKVFVQGIKTADVEKECITKRRNERRRNGKKKQLKSEYTYTNQRTLSRYQQRKPKDSSSPITKNEE